MPRPQSDIPQRIVNAARARFLREGVDGASLRGIAEDAGTSIGMVYYYYPTKDELFSAVVEDVYRDLLVDLRALLSAEQAPERRVAAIYARIAAMDERELDVARLMVREALVSSERLRRLAARFERGHVPLVLQTLGEGMAAGRIDAALGLPVIMAATATLAIMPQLVHHAVSTAGLEVAQLLPSRAEAAQGLVQVLLFGVAGDALRSERAREASRKAEPKREPKALRRRERAAKAGR